MKNLTLGQMERFFEVLEAEPVTKKVFDALEAAKEEYEPKDRSLKETLKTMTLDDIVNFIEEMKKFSEDWREEEAKRSRLERYAEMLIKERMKKHPHKSLESIMNTEIELYIE